MAILRMQDPRQLYGLGSLVKKALRGVKKIVKSPIGKAALLAGGAYFVLDLVGFLSRLVFVGVLAFLISP